MEQFDVLVFIGRFQPPHAGHLRVIQTALERAAFVVVVCGSSDDARSPRNPWSFDERANMIRSVLTAADNDRVVIQPLQDVRYNDGRWISVVRDTVRSMITARYPQRAEPAVGLIGICDDRFAQYARWFPEWGTLNIAPTHDVNGTAIRRVLFEDRAGVPLERLAAMVAPDIFSQIRTFTTTAAYRALEQEVDFVEHYRSAWAGAPFVPIFVTADAVTVQSGRVLLVQRGGFPGKGLLALPGGFVDPGERLQDACLRELKEETCIDVDHGRLISAVKRHEVFDDPYRSARGRTITHAYLLLLEPGPDLPAVTGNDDAQRAMWVSLGELDRSLFFEDHYAILQVLLGAP